MKFSALCVCVVMTMSGGSRGLAAGGQGVDPDIGHGAGASVVWFDLMVAEPQRAKDFYSDVFGWRFAPPSQEYTLILAGDRPIGGLYQGRSMVGQHGGIDIYFSVTNLASVLAKAKAKGAKVIIESMPIPGGHGSMALFQDLDGNGIGLVQGES